MDDKVIIAIFTGIEGVHAYSAFLPSVFTIKTFVETKEGRDMIREGEVMATAFLLALAFTTAKLTKSWYPALFAMIAGGSMLAVYEYALARCPYNRENSTEVENGYGY